MRYVKGERILLKSHPDLGEKWVQARIAEDPSILGLGDLVLRDQERIQPKGGRLDLLLQDPDTLRRYEVELQLGATDEAHIIRTIEYWDIEKKRYPQYDHCAVIVAEEITARFLNVISLFNGTIPLIALQMQAMKFGDDLALIFTTVMDEMKRGLVDEDEDAAAAPADRTYWETQRGTKETVAMADKVLKIVHEFQPDLHLKYNKFYIGLSRDGQANNFIWMRPQKKGNLMLAIGLPRSEEIEKLIEDAGLDTLDYDARGSNYRVRLTKGEVEQRQDTLRRLLKMAHDYRNG